MAYYPEHLRKAFHDKVIELSLTHKEVAIIMDAEPCTVIKWLSDKATGIDSQWQHRVIAFAAGYLDSSINELRQLIENAPDIATKLFTTLLNLNKLCNEYDVQRKNESIKSVNQIMLQAMKNFASKTKPIK